MEEKNKPIGVFDSGVGGLTVLQRLVEQFPSEHFIYLADQKYCPYGVKTPAQITERVVKVTSFLLSNGVKAIVIACNTASARIAVAREITSKPIISVIQPTCAKAVEETKSKRVAVLATLSTVQSGIYQQLLEQSGITPVLLACGEFVDFVENHDLDDPMGDKIVCDKLQPIKDSGVDVLIHGCTHFSLLEESMRKVLGKDITYVACGAPTAEYLAKILTENNLLTVQNGRGCVEIYTTDSVEKANQSMKWFNVPHLPVQHVDIE